MASDGFGDASPHDAHADLQILDADGTPAVAVTLTPIGDDRVPAVLAERARELLETEFGDRVVDLHE